jgi:hypothetical protein
MTAQRDRAALDGPPRGSAVADRADAWDAWDKLLPGAARGAARDARLLAADERAWAHERITWARELWATTRDVSEQAVATRRRTAVLFVRAMDLYMAALEAWTWAEEVRARAAAAGGRALVLRDAARQPAPATLESVVPARSRP